MEDRSDPVDAAEAALTDAWDAIPAPLAYAVRILMVDADNDDSLAAVYAPYIISDAPSAQQLQAILAQSIAGEQLMGLWVNQGKMQLPDPARRWIPIATRVVQLAEIPF